MTTNLSQDNENAQLKEEKTQPSKLRVPRSNRGAPTNNPFDIFREWQFPILLSHLEQPNSSPNPADSDKQLTRGRQA